MIYIAADHRGFEAKAKIKDFLVSEGYVVKDLGAEMFDETDDYPDFAFKLGEEVSTSKERGILICGSGIGVTIAANKVRGVRAGYVESKDHAIKSRSDDDTNVLVLDAMTFDTQKDFEVIKTWLETKFSGEERHSRRLKKIKLYEENN